MDAYMLIFVAFYHLFHCNYLIPSSKSWPSTQRHSDHRKTYTLV